MFSAALAFPLKSPEAFRTISEVALELDVPQHVLRFWESRFVQIRPVKRAGGRRYYRPEDVDLLRGIRALLYGDGFTIKGVQKVLRDRGLRHVAEIGRGEICHLRSTVRLSEAQMPAAPIAENPVRLLHREIAAAHIAPLSDAVPDRLALEQRAKLQALLAELLQMKARLRAGVLSATRA